MVAELNVFHSPSKCFLIQSFVEIGHASNIIIIIFEFCYIVMAAEDVLDGGTKEIWTPSAVAQLSFHEAAI